MLNRTEFSKVVPYEKGKEVPVGFQDSVCIKKWSNGTGYYILVSEKTSRSLTTADGSKFVCKNGIFQYCKRNIFEVYLSDEAFYKQVEIKKMWSSIKELKAPLHLPLEKLQSIYQILKNELEYEAAKEHKHKKS